MAKKPIMPWVLAGLGVAALVKGVFRPHRAVAKKGLSMRCAGQEAGGCQQADTIVVEHGSPIYATGSGRVVAVGPHYVHILVANEPVILMYDGIDPDVELEQYVGRGQTIGYATQVPGGSPGTRVAFSVTEMMPSGKGAPALAVVPPAAWLAARGMRLLVKDTNPSKASLWCADRRHIDVPTASGKACNFVEPDPASFALLPVSVSVET